MSALNRVGEGSLSPYSINIKAANVPGKPATPWYISSTSTTITLGWNDDQDNGGALITYYQLYTDNGVLISNTYFYLDTTSDLTYTLDTATFSNYTTGQIYKFRLTAVNEIGESSPSNYIRIALAALPLAPN